MGKKTSKRGVAAIKTYMEEHGLSQKEFGELVDVSQGLVWQWVHGETAVTADKAREIESKTGIPRMKLLYPSEPRAA